MGVTRHCYSLVLGVGFVLFSCSRSCGEWAVVASLSCIFLAVRLSRDVEPWRSGLISYALPYVTDCRECLWVLIIPVLRPD